MAIKKKRPDATVELKLTAKELEVIRDVFGVLMPIATDAGELVEGCVAEYVAAVTGRVKLEQVVWRKIVKACATLGVVTGDAAPTFAVSAAHAPTLHVYEIEG